MADVVTEQGRSRRSASMAVEAAQSHNQLGKVRTDVLSDARLACYKARDAFYACLEKESSKKPTEIAMVGLVYPAECKKTRAAYEKQCRSYWVKHFDRDYCAKKKVKRFLDDPNAKRGPLIQFTHLEQALMSDPV
ncbi:unnamed protein product [Rhodiola kirilowii]